MSIILPGEEEFFAQEKSITDTVIRVIASAKKELQLLSDEELKQTIVISCKSAVAKTLEFQTIVKCLFRY